MKNNPINYKDIGRLLKTKNLNDLFDKEKLTKIFIENQDELNLSPDITIDKIVISTGLAERTFLYGYEIYDHGKSRLFRGNASMEDSRQYAYNLLKMLKQKNFDQQDQHIINNFAYNKAYNLFIYENIEGGTLQKNLLENPSDAQLKNIFNLCGNWLKKLHLVPGQVNLPAHQWKFLKTFLIKKYPEFNDLEIRVDQTLGKKKYPKKGLIHGDYHANNILVKNDQIWVIDFNEASLDNPMIDVARFISQLRSILIQNDLEQYYESYSNIFLENYSQDNPISQEMEYDINLYLSLRYLQILAFLCAWSDGSEKQKTILDKIYKLWKEYDSKI